MSSPYIEEIAEAATTDQGAAPYMRAARIAAPRRLEIVSVPLPVPGPGQVRIRLEGCGVCGSNLAPWQGRPWFKYPLADGAPGHEGWGRVNALGPGVHHYKIGERVGFLAAQSFAEFALAETATLVRAPQRAAVFPGEALACAVNIFRRAEIAAKQTVAVVGCGFIGTLLVQFAARRGARVLALARRPYGRQIARYAGADATFECDTKAVGRIMELTGGAGCARVIEAAGSQESLTLAGRMVQVRGRLIIAGYHQDGPREVNMQLWNWRGIDVINAHERDPNAYASGMSAAADWIDRAGFDPSYLYTHRFALDRLADAFDALQERPAGFMKGWIAF